MKFFIPLFFLFPLTLQAAQPTQSDCEYWLSRLDAISYWERAKLNSIEAQDKGSERYFRKLLRWEIQQIERDAFKGLRE